MEPCPSPPPAVVSDPSIWDAIQPWASPIVAIIAAVIAFFAYLNARRARKATEKSANASEKSAGAAQDSAGIAKQQLDHSLHLEEKRDREDVTEIVLDLANKIIAMLSNVDLLIVAMNGVPRDRDQDDPEVSAALRETGEKYANLVQACHTYTNASVMSMQKTRTLPFIELKDVFGTQTVDVLTSYESVRTAGVYDMNAFDAVRDKLIAMRETGQSLSAAIRDWLDETSNKP